jgi:hypothetical protein
MIIFKSTDISTMLYPSRSRHERDLNNFSGDRQPTVKVVVIPITIRPQPRRPLKLGHTYTNIYTIHNTKDI